MTQLTIRDVRPDDLSAVRDINEASVPHVNSVSLAMMRRLHAMAAYFRVATFDGRVVGFLIGLTPEAPYDSPNFRKFRVWFPAFVYIDRVAVTDAARGRGVGRALYEDLQGFARSVAPLVTCEVNLLPHNGTSLAFHRRLGFSQAGTQKTDGGAKTVALLTKDPRLTPPSRS